jgi:hypothetical protein
MQKIDLSIDDLERLHQDVVLQASNNDLAARLSDAMLRVRDTARDVESDLIRQPRLQSSGEWLRRRDGLSEATLALRDLVPLIQRAHADAGIPVGGKPPAPTRVEKEARSAREHDSANPLRGPAPLPLEPPGPTQRELIRATEDRAAKTKEISGSLFRELIKLAGVRKSKRGEKGRRFTRDEIRRLVDGAERSGKQDRVRIARSWAQFLDPPKSQEDHEKIA